VAHNIGHPHHRSSSPYIILPVIAHNFLVVMVEDFNVPGFDWKRDLFLPNSRYYSKRFTPPRVLLIIVSALILLATVI
jgi:hypothetical protein